MDGDPLDWFELQIITYIMLSAISEMFGVTTVCLLYSRPPKWENIAEFFENFEEYDLICVIEGRVEFTINE